MDGASRWPRAFPGDGRGGRTLTVWSPWVDAKYSPSAENASAIVDFAVSGRGMYEADLPEPYMSSRLQSSRSLLLRPVSSRWNSSECTPARLRVLDIVGSATTCFETRNRGGGHFDNRGRMQQGHAVGAPVYKTESGEGRVEHLGFAACLHLLEAGASGRVLEAAGKCWTPQACWTQPAGDTSSGRCSSPSM